MILCVCSSLIFLKRKNHQLSCRRSINPIKLFTFQVPMFCYCHGGMCPPCVTLTCMFSELVTQLGSINITVRGHLVRPGTGQYINSVRNVFLVQLQFRYVMFVEMTQKHANSTLLTTVYADAWVVYLYSENYGSCLVLIPFKINKKRIFILNHDPKTTHLVYHYVPST